MKRNLPLGLALLTLTAVTQAHAQFVPIPLTSESYTFDVVVEEGAPFFTPSTTASMDGGTNNTGNTFYEVGFNFDAPETGFPVAGSTVVSETLPDHSFQLAADYTANNALLIDPTLTNATLTLNTPAAYSAISFLTSAANGAVVLNYTLHFSDGTSEDGTFTAPDWFGATPVAITTSGRVSPTTGGFANVGSADPRVYTADIEIANATKTINSIELTFGSGGANGRAAIFAVSASNGGEFTSIAVSGFNQDMIVEANAPRNEPLGVTTATVDRGAENTMNTFYEVGYNTNAPATGLPAAGSTLTNVSAPNYVYQLAPSYENASNAAVVDAFNTTAALTLATPASYSALSLLGSSGAGAVTVSYQINYTDSTTQTGQILIPDWFNVTPYAFAVRGRVHVDNGSFSAVNTENPRLYAVDIAVDKTTTPIASVELTHVSGNGHATIFALSGTAGAVKPIFESQPWSTNALAGTTAELIATVSGTAPITFQWQREVNGNFVTVENSATVNGASTPTLSFSNLALTNAGLYRLLATNIAGASTSVVATLNVISTLQDVTSPFDTVEMVGGTAPANEPVANAIDDTTSKYLNFGTDGNNSAPFAGPVGLTVTPALGSTVVTGLRIYTANDAVERDPANYTLEGSNDGTTFTVISSGALALPAARNAAALGIDPLTLANQEVLFSNTAGYTTYRLTFADVKNNTTANSMQLGEIELLGEAGTGTPQGPTLQVARDGANITISWNGPGTLQATPTLDSPQWTDVTTTSPATVETTGNYRFFRVERSE